MQHQEGSQETVGNDGLPPDRIRDEVSLRPDEERLLALMEEFRRRQRKRPDLVVRPWWSPGPEEVGRARLGFVVEYCPNGRESVELVVRGSRVTVDGPSGAQESRLDLDGAWSLDGEDAGCPETLANYLIRLADRSLESEAA